MSLAATCANCHGTNGVGVPNAGMPQINHLSPDAMLTQLKAFKSGARTGSGDASGDEGHGRHQTLEFHALLLSRTRVSAYGDKRIRGPVSGGPVNTL